MTKKPKATPLEDEEQSRRFLEIVRELEAAGDVSPTEADAAFERAMNRVAKAKRPSEPEPE